MHCRMMGKRERMSVAACYVAVVATDEIRIMLLLGIMIAHKRKAGGTVVTSIPPSLPTGWIYIMTVGVSAIIYLTPMIGFKVIDIHIGQSFAARISTVSVHFVPIQATGMKIPRTGW